MAKKKAKKKTAVKVSRPRAKDGSTGMRLSKLLREKISLLRKSSAKMRVALEQLRDAESQR